MRRNRPKANAHVPPEAKAASEGERIKLTAQQAASVLASQQAASAAREQANLVLRGVLDAAGIDQAEVIGGNVADAEPYLTIRRK